MKLFSSLAIATAALGLASSANASISIYSNTPGTNPYTGPTPTYTFDPGSQPTVSGGSFVTGSVPNSFQQPLGAVGNYYAVGPTPGNPGTIDLSAWGNINSISFLWGSVDGYNTLDFLAANGTTVLATFGGNNILAGATGTQTQLVTFLLTGTDVSAFTYLRLSSTTNAFEIDDVAINPPVPEPATWAMMLLGFGGIGVAMRRRRSAKLAQLA